MVFSRLALQAKGLRSQPQGWDESFPTEGVLSVTRRCVPAKLLVHDLLHIFTYKSIESRHYRLIKHTRSTSTQSRLSCESLPTHHLILHHLVFVLRILYSLHYHTNPDLKSPPSSNQHVHHSVHHLQPVQMLGPTALWTQRTGTSNLQTSGRGTPWLCLPGLTARSRCHR